MPAASDAVDAALRALGRRDLSAHDLDLKLEARGFGPAEREAVVESLERSGLVDDGRYARARAETLAGRGAGNAFIRHDLVRAGLEHDLVETAIDGLEPEEARARAVVACRGPGSRTARYLSGKGFPDEVVSAVAGGHASGLG